ncbi:uncharacterized protein TNCV_2925651 [Trichonephila clavipes]|nr:uncharacterized protein TNCV_2925651 [Trichonephila clavipes]
MSVGAISGSGIFIKKRNGIRICKRNPDYYSVFRAEILAIEEVLKLCFIQSVNTDIWIFSDIAALFRIYLNSGSKWVPSQVNVCRNEIVDGLAIEDSHKDSTHGGCLTFSEIAIRIKQDISSSWRKTPYMSGMKETVLACLGQAADEMKLLLLSFSVDILELNGMWRVLKFTLLIRI